jgi:predicted NAD/FAD-binding protein
MRIAVIGAGISGMVAAYRLCSEHDVTVYEAGGYIGGHTNTVDVSEQGRDLAIDTGFIVHNDWTYPNFVALLEELGVPWQESDMSFSVRCEKSGLEYNGTSLNSLFAQRRNLVRPSFLRMVADILRFGSQAQALLAPGAPDLSLGDYLRENGYSRFFIEHYIVPMGAAVWSSRPADMLQFPARFLVEFFANHGFLSVNHRPVWRVIRGGSREYVKRLTAPYATRIRLNTPVDSLIRQPLKVCMRLKNGTVEHFDQVFIACHSDQALKMLGDASTAERAILGAIAYQENEALLHTDIRLMPRRRLAWAAWNYHIPQGPVERAAVTYNMNILQSLHAAEQYMVSLNRSEEIDPKRVLGRYVYHHPVYTAAAVAAQRRRSEINGTQRTYYCGAYWGYGFHEDGVKSAQDSLGEFARRERYAQPNLQRVG